MRKPKVQFTRTQLEYLDKQVCPEFVGTSTTTEAEFRYRAGQRSVYLTLLHLMAAETGAPEHGVF